MVIDLRHRFKIISSFITINILRNVLGIVRSKLVAIVYGSQQVGLLGQFLSFNNFQGRFVTFGISASLVNSISKIEENNWSKKQVLLLNLLIIVIANLVNTLIIGFFSTELAILIYGNNSYSIYIWMGLFLNYIYSVTTFIEISFQANQNFNILGKSRAIGIGIAILFVIPLTLKFGVIGIILDLFILYSSSLLYLFTKINWNDSKTIFSKINKDENKRILIYILRIAGTDFFRAMLVLGSIVLIRMIIIHHFDLTAAGFYYAIVAISGYSNVLAEGFMVYYFPTISHTQTNVELKKEININIELLFYIITPILIIIAVFSKFLLKILFSAEFGHLDLFLKLLAISKIFYIVYFLYTINLLGKNKLQTFLYLEGLRSFILVLSTLFFIRIYQFSGLIYSLVFTEIISIFFLSIIIKGKTEFYLNKNNIKLILFSAIIISISLLPIDIIWQFIITLFSFIAVFDLRKYKKILKFKNKIL